MTLTAGPDRVLPLLLWLLLAAVAAAQEPRPSPAELEGRPVVRVAISGQLRGAEARIRANLRTAEGRLFAAAEAGRDVKRLWEVLGLKAEVQARAVEGGVEVRFEVEAPASFARFRFTGLHALTEEEAARIMDLREGQSLTEVFARARRELLAARYERLGYVFAHIKIDARPAEDALVFQVEEGPKVRVDEIRVRGARSFPLEANFGLRKNLLGSAGVELAPNKFVSGRLPAAELESWLFGPVILLGNVVEALIPPPPWSAVTLEEDLERLRDFYRGEGYRDAVVELERLSFSPDRTRVTVHLLVAEGPRYRVASVDLRQELPSGRDRPAIPREELLPRFALKPGEPYRMDLVRLDSGLLKEEYGRRGYPHYDPRNDDLKADETFEVLQPLEVFDPGRATVAVTYRVREGWPKRVRKVKITGNENTRDEVVRREVSLHPGDTLDTVKLQESLFRLDSLQYFEDQRGATTVRKSLRSVPDSPEEVDLEIDLREGKTGNFLWSAGVSTNIGFFGRFTVRRRNFDLLRPPTTADPVGAIAQILNGEAFAGGGQTLSFDVQPGSKLNFFNINFQEPDLFGLYEERVGLSTDLYKRWRYYEDFRDERLGIFVKLSRLIARRTTLFAGLRSEDVEISDIDQDAAFTVWDSEGNSRFRTLELGGEYDGTDHPMQPAAGFRGDLRHFLAGPLLGGEEEILGFSTTAQFFHPVWQDGRGRSHVLALRGDFDWVGGYGGSDRVHVGQRLFLGGRGTVRGFRFRGAGPSQFRNPVGGEARWLGSLEYQLPLFSVLPERGDREIDMVRLVVFTDAGGLGLDLGDSTFGELRLAAGIGVRIRIPGLSFLPVAVDFGWPLVRQGTDQGQVFSFVLGLY